MCYWGHTRNCHSRLKALRVLLLVRLLKIEPATEEADLRVTYTSSL